MTCELVGSAKRLRGVGIRDLLTMEKLFKVSITIFKLETDLTSNVLLSSKVNYPSKLRLNLHGNHFNLIKRLALFAKAYDCLICAGSFTTLFNLGRHLIRPEHYRNLRVSAYTEWGRALA